MTTSRETAHKAPSRALQPVGVLEIAEALNVRQDTVNKWRDRFPPTEPEGFPEPRWFVSGFPAWNLPDVLAWSRATGHPSNGRA